MINTVSEQAFAKGKKRIKDFWPEDRIIKEEPNKLIIQCENGAFLIYTRIVLPEECMDSPEMVAMMHEKVMLQFTEKLEDSSYNNISRELAGLREPKGRVKEALQEFAKRLQIAGILYP